MNLYFIWYFNEFLKLKNNKAKEGNTAEPQKIKEGWPKKYPVSEKDTDIKGINLFDTEGIEKTGENGPVEKIYWLKGKANRKEQKVRKKIQSEHWH